MSIPHKFAGKPIRIAAALRQELEDAIQAHLTAVEKLTAVLDHADGDADLEPSLGDYPYGTPLDLLDCEGDEHDGREPQCEDEGAACEDEGAEHDGREPSLGALNPEPARSQTGWAEHGEDVY